jgi:hypothetical protein
VLIGVILLDDESFEGYGDGIVPADQRAGVDLVVPVHHDRRRARLHRSVRAGEKRSGQGDDLGGRAVHQQLAVWPMQARPDDAAQLAGTAPWMPSDRHTFSLASMMSSPGRMRQITARG